MFNVKTTVKFDKWYTSLKDLQTKARVQARIFQLESGHFGDVKTVGDNVSELRFHFGSGYRIYFTRKDGAIIILLVGGDKSTQANDIDVAKQLAKQLTEVSND